jgi:hypothetical protein
MAMDRVLLDELQSDEALHAFRALLGEVIPQDLDTFDRASQVRLQARAKAQDYLVWLRKREEGKEVCT